MDGFDGLADFLLSSDFEGAALGNVTPEEWIAYAGDLYRLIHRTQHVDAADREDAGSLFTV